MNEFIQEAIHSFNLPLTLLMGLVVIFWILSLLGTIDMDSLDLDLDVDAGTDADADVDSEVDVGHNILGTTLKLVNAQDVPIMMVLSLLTLFMWTISIITNFYINPDKSALLALGLLVGNFIVSVLLVNLITQPLRPIFRAIKKDEEHVPLVGSIGTVKSRVIDQKYGQVEVIREGGSPALLNARLEDGALTRGETVIITSYDDNNKRYLVKSAPELNLTTNN